MTGLALRRRTQTAARGRPPRVSAESIVAAAIDIGLSRVTLAEVASRLGVTVPALYRHVRNRDEIVKLAAIQLTMQRGQPITGRGGLASHWSEVVKACAHGMVECLFDLHRSELAQCDLLCDGQGRAFFRGGSQELTEPVGQALELCQA